MLYRTLAAAGIFLLLALPATASEDGLVRVQSNYSVSETLDRLTAALESKGITVFARIDHAAGAASIGSELAPSEVLVFGNPKLGTPLMQSNPEIGLDLPLKALAYEDAEGKVQLVYLDPAALKERYGIDDRDQVFTNMANALSAFSKAASE